MPDQYDNPQAGFASGLFSGLMGSINDQIKQARQRNRDKEDQEHDFQIRSLLTMADKVKPEDLPIFMEKVSQIASMKGKPAGIKGALSGKTDLTQQVLQGVHGLVSSMLPEQEYRRQQGEAQPDVLASNLDDLNAGVMPQRQFAQLPGRIRMRDPLREKMEFDALEQQNMLSRQLAVRQAEYEHRRQLGADQWKGQGDPVFDPQTNQWFQREQNGIGEVRNTPLAGEPLKVRVQKTRNDRPDSVLARLRSVAATMNPGMTPDQIERAGAELFMKDFNSRLQDRSARLTYYTSQVDRKQAFDDMERDYKLADGILENRTGELRNAQAMLKDGTRSHADAVAQILGVQIPAEYQKPEKILELKSWLNSRIAAAQADVNMQRADLSQRLLRDRTYYSGLTRTGQGAGTSPSVPQRPSAPSARAQKVPRPGDTGIKNSVDRILESLRGGGQK